MNRDGQADSEVMMQSKRLGELIPESVGATYVGCDANTAVTTVAVDSRRVGPGAVFVAVAGHSRDGHQFLADVYAGGANVAIIQRGTAVMPGGPHVWVDDTQRVLPVLAARFYGDPAASLRLAGITGTNGKTTVSHLVSAILSAAGRLHARLGTTGNWIANAEEPASFTTPFPLDLQELLARARDRGATNVVMEVSSHALSQERVDPLRYHAVGMTSFSQDHLDFHHDMQDYLQAKCLLASRYLRNDGIAVAPVDGHGASEAFLAAARGTGATVWTASRGAVPSADICARQVSYSNLHMQAVVDTPRGAFELHSPLVGSFNFDNLLVATGLALGLGISLEHIAAGLATSHGAPGRLEPVAVAGVAGPSVFVDYAHTPDAVARVLAAIRSATRGRLIVVLGCGGDRDPSKRPQMGALAASATDVFFATSDNPRSEDPESIVDAMIAGISAADLPKVVREIDRARAIARAVIEAEPADTVVIAGKGHETYQIVGDTRVAFDDREHARAALLRR